MERLAPAPGPNGMGRGGKVQLRGMPGRPEVGTQRRGPQVGQKTSRAGKALSQPQGRGTCRQMGWERPQGLLRPERRGPDSRPLLGLPPLQYPKKADTKT